MGAASVSEYVASLNEEQRRHISAFIDFMNGTYPQLTIKISFSMPIKCSPSQGQIHLTHGGSMPSGYSPVVM